MEATVSFGGNFDVQLAKPMDARTMQKSFDAFTVEENWRAKDGNFYVYKGLTVTTQDEARDYVLTVAPAKDVDGTWNFCKKENWRKKGTLL